jgi:hypothetical protein
MDDADHDRLNPDCPVASKAFIHARLNKALTLVFFHGYKDVKGYRVGVHVEWSERNTCQHAVPAMRSRIEHQYQEESTAMC